MRKNLLSACLIFVLTIHGSSQIPTSGLVAYWPMNGNYTDAGPYGIHGTNAGSNATTNKFGAASSAMSFSNPTSTVSQYATHPANSNLSFSASQDFTISFLFYMNSPWVRTGGFYDNGLNNRGIGIWIWNSPGTPTIQFNFRNGSLASTTIALGTWKHATCIRTSGTLRIYIDGVQVASGPEGTGTPAYTYPAYFGTMYATSLSPAQYNGLNGKMDEVRIYNRALSATEVAQLASAVLPLQLGDFSGIKTAEGINLYWETLSEQNTKGFEIQRSPDGSNFTGIGYLAAAGNSTNKRSYSFTDKQPLPSTSFYRLKMVDIDGAVSYSRVLIIRNINDADNILHLYPNPATDVIQAQILLKTESVVQLTVTDLAGKEHIAKLLKLNKGANTISIPVIALPASSYYLRIKNQEFSKTATFIKH